MHTWDCYIEYTDEMQFWVLSYSILTQWNHENTQVWPGPRFSLACTIVALRVVAYGRAEPWCVYLYSPQRQKNLSSSFTPTSLHPNKMSRFIVPSEWQPDRRTRDGLPLHFEDRTGYITNTDFDDMYDRMHFHVSRLPGQTSTNIFRMGFRPSRLRDTLPLPPNPEVSLHFGPHEALGTISLSLMSAYTANLPMTQYLQKTSFFASSLSRKFFASDGREYKWGFRVRPEQEWTCTTMDNILVAYYGREKEYTPQIYEVSGHNLMIFEDYAQIAIEVIASFLIMRHIKLFNL